MDKKDKDKKIASSFFRPMNPEELGEIASLKNVKVVSTNEDGPTKSVTIEVPLVEVGDNIKALASTEGAFVLNREPAIGGAIQLPTEIGERYGLKPFVQTLSLPKNDDFHGQIQLAKALYRREPLVGNVIDLMVDLAATGMENDAADTKAKKFFDGVCKYSNFDRLHRQILFEYFLSSDVFIVRGRPKTINKGQGAGSIAFNYTILNAEYVTIEGPLVFDGDEEIVFYPSDTLQNQIIEKKPGWVKNTKNLRATTKVKRFSFNSGKDVIGLIMDRKYTSRISRMRQPYERYATPYVAKIFEPCLIKRRMREADLAANETIRNVLITITCGDDEHPATSQELTALASLFANPAKTMELVWNHTLKVEYHWPDAALLGAGKYEQVNRDILEGLGVPMVLLTGEGGNFATAYVGIMSFVERLNKARKQIARWQEEEYIRIAEEVGKSFKEIPSVRFDSINLRDERTFKTLLLQMKDRGLLSTETMIEEFGYDFEAIKREIEIEDKDGTKKLFENNIFVPNAGMEKGLKEGIKTEDKNPEGKAMKSPTQKGRPTDNPNKGNYTKRNPIPKPKGET